MNLARYFFSKFAIQRKKSELAKKLMLQLILLTLGIVSANSSQITALVVQSKINDKVTVQRLSVEKDQPSYKTHLIWESTQGISCTLSLSQSNVSKAEGTIECVSKSGYKAQTNFNCLLNRNIESGAYLFFGKVGVSDENKNFTIWCEG